MTEPKNIGRDFLSKSNQIGLESIEFEKLLHLAIFLGFSRFYQNNREFQHLEEQNYLYDQ